MYDLGFIERSEYLNRRKQYAREYESRQSKRKKEYRVPHSRIVVRDNGRHFTRVVLSAYSDAEISARDVSNLLDVRLKHMSRIESELFPSRWNGAAEE